MSADILFAKTEADVRKCWSVFQSLRPNIDEELYLKRMLEMFTEGYTMAYVENESHQPVSAIGFRYLQMLHNGKQIYIDDLTTLPSERGKGYASKLLDYVIDLAKQKGYDCVTLDSGPHRHDAHRLYLNKGFIIASHHFIKTLNP